MRSVKSDPAATDLSECCHNLFWFANFQILLWLRSISSCLLTSPAHVAPALPRLVKTALQKNTCQYV